MYGVYGLAGLTSVLIYPHRLLVTMFNVVLAYMIILLAIEGYIPEPWEFMPRGYVQRVGEFILLAAVVHLLWNGLRRLGQHLSASRLLLLK